jgi:hypothetical protein
MGNHAKEATSKLPVVVKWDNPENVEWVFLPTTKLRAIVTVLPAEVNRPLTGGTTNITVTNAAESSRIRVSLRIITSFTGTALRNTLPG